MRRQFFGKTEFDRFPVWRLSDRCHDFVVEAEHLLGLDQKISAVFGQFDMTAFSAGEQGLSQKRFQALHLQGNGRLGASNKLRCPRKTSLLGDDDKAAQQIEIKSYGKTHGHECFLLEEFIELVFLSRLLVE